MVRAAALAYGACSVLMQDEDFENSTVEPRTSTGSHDRPGERERGQASSPGRRSKPIRAPFLTTHVVMHEKEPARIVSTFYLVKPCVILSPM